MAPEKRERTELRFGEHGARALTSKRVEETWHVNRRGDTVTRVIL